MMKKILCILLSLAALFCFASCGGKDENPFAYTQNTDGTVTVAAYRGKNEAAVTVPDTYLDRKVTAIGDMAFEGTVMLTKVIIPDGVTAIGASAFANCQRLAEIDLPNELTTIGDWAFQNCKLLTAVVIPEGVTEIGSHAFKGCVGLTSVALPAGIKTIGTEAFSELTSLTSYTGPMKHLNEMPKEKLTAVTIMAGEFDQIEFVTFYGCESLTEITYTGTVAAWQALDKADGWLTSLPEKTLLVHCTDGEVTETA